MLFAIDPRCCFQCAFKGDECCAFEGDECAFKGDEWLMPYRWPISASFASADDSDKPVAFLAFRQCCWAADELLLQMCTCFVVDLEKIARSPWRYHDGVRPGRRPERQHPEEHCRWGRETHCR